MSKKINIEEVFANFPKGINCCMDVFGAVADDIGLSEEEAKRIGAGFGGGMGLAGPCGAVTGAMMAIGYKYGNYEPGDTQQEEIFKAKKGEFIKEFKARFGNVNCVELLDGLNPAVPEEKMQIAEKNLMHDRCADMVCQAVEILEDIL